MVGTDWLSLGYIPICCENHKPFKVGTSIKSHTQKLITQSHGSWRLFMTIVIWDCQFMDIDRNQELLGISLSSLQFWAANPATMAIFHPWWSHSSGVDRGGFHALGVALKRTRARRPTLSALDFWMTFTRLIKVLGGHGALPWESRWNTKTLTCQSFTKIYWTMEKSRTTLINGVVLQCIARVNVNVRPLHRPLTCLYLV